MSCVRYQRAGPGFSQSYSSFLSSQVIYRKSAVPQMVRDKEQGKLFQNKHQAN